MRLTSYWHRWQARRFERRARETFGIVCLVLERDEKARKVLRQILRYDEGRKPRRSIP
jgi:hypothetical protein